MLFRSVSQSRYFLPGTRIPDTRIPDTRIPDTRIPDTRIPDTRIPDTRIPDTRIPDHFPHPRTHAVRLPNLRFQAPERT